MAYFLFIILNHHLLLSFNSLFNVHGKQSHVLVVGRRGGVEGVQEGGYANRNQEKMPPYQCSTVHCKQTTKNSCMIQSI